MPGFDFDDPLTKLNLIGKRRSEILSKHQISSIRDIIYYFPRKHLDRTNITSIQNIERGNRYNIIGKIETLGEKSTRFKKIFQVIISDGTGFITLT